MGILREYTATRVVAVLEKYNAILRGIAKEGVGAKSFMKMLPEPPTEGNSKK